MEVGRSQLLPPHPSLPHQHYNGKERQHMYNSEYTPRCSKGRRFCKWKHVKAQRKAERLSSKVQQCRDLGGLWLIAIRDVREYVGADDLQAKCCNANTHDRSRPMSVGLEADAFNDHTDRHKKGTWPDRLQAGFGNRLAVMRSSVEKEEVV